MQICRDRKYITCYLGQRGVRGEKTGERVDKGYEASFWDDEYVLKLTIGGSYSTLNIRKTTH